MKKPLLIPIILLVCIHLQAQQLPQYSNYMLNDYVINPAVGGSNPYFEGKSDNRYQWVGITDAPRTYILSVDGPLKSLNMGLGGMLFTDIVGPTRRTGFYLSYAYHLKITPKVRLSFGLSAGLLQFQVDASQIQLHDQGDMVISNGVQSTLLPDFGAGIYTYSTNHKWYAGVSVPQIFQEQLKFFDKQTSSLSTLATHLYITGGYKFNLSDDYKLEPSTLIQFVSPAPVQINIGLRAIYKDMFWLGCSYRSMDAVSAMVGYTMMQNITFAYSYDFTTTDIRKYSSGTHEIMISIKFFNSKNKGK